MKKFEKLCENFGVIRKTVKIMYPRQIKFSEKFLGELKQEYFRQKLEEDASTPIKDRPEKFIKGLRFHISEFEGNMQKELEAYKRMMDEKVHTSCEQKKKTQELKKVEIEKGKVLQRNMGKQPDIKPKKA